jgi:hypothetical protein
MPDYQIDTQRKGGLRVKVDGAVVGELRPGWLIKDLSGEIGGQPVKLSLPAPWRGMRYRAEQGGREIANAPKPQSRRGMVTYEVEMPGRRFEYASEDTNGLVYLLTESGEQVGRYAWLPFDEQHGWNAEVTLREDSVAFAAFLAWLVFEARAHHRR